jgi:hypothetical protein
VRRMVARDVIGKGSGPRKALTAQGADIRPILGMHALMALQIASVLKSLIAPRELAREGSLASV